MKPRHKTTMLEALWLAKNKASFVCKPASWIDNVALAYFTDTDDFKVIGLDADMYSFPTKAQEIFREEWEVWDFEDFYEQSKRKLGVKDSNSEKGKSLRKLLTDPNTQIT